MFSCIDALLCMWIMCMKACMCACINSPAYTEANLGVCQQYVFMFSGQTLCYALWQLQAYEPYFVFLKWAELTGSGEFLQRREDVLTVPFTGDDEGDTHEVLAAHQQRRAPGRQWLLLHLAHMHVQNLKQSKMTLCKHMQNISIPILSCTRQYQYNVTVKFCKTETVTHTHTHTHARTYACTHARTYARMHTHT